MRHHQYRPLREHEVRVERILPPVLAQRVHQRNDNEGISQSPEDAAGSRLRTAQDVPTIVQAVLYTLPSQTVAPTPMQSSDAEVAPSPGISGDDVPNKLLVS